MKISLNWPDFKAIVDSKNLAIQELEATKWGYILAACDGPIKYDCRIDEDDNAGTDKQQYEDNYKESVNQPIMQFSSPFASKILPNGKKLYERKHGIPFSGTVEGMSAQEITYSIPYVSCKITALEIQCGCKGDQVDFFILDTPTGTVSGFPNAPLNQFGFGVFIAEGTYKEESRYDADLFYGLQIKIVYHNNSDSPCNPRFNVTLHEVKD